MQAHQGRFRLARVSHAESPPTSNVPQLGYSSPAPSFIDFRIHPDPTPAKATRGSFEYDLGTGKYQKQWTDWAEFLLWRSQEERDKSIELRLVNTYQGAAGVYERQCRYVCSRAGTGGVKTYTKLNPAWIHKLPSKRTDCPCCLLVKQYPGTSTVLGNYSEDHNHAIGNENLRFTQIPRETKEYIAGLLRLKVSPDHILQLIHHGVYNNDDDFERDFDDTFVASRNEFIQLKDIRRIEKEIEAETVRLSPDDGLSTLRWVENLRARGHLLGFKSKTDPPPPGSNLAPDLFLLMIQTGWQRKMFAKYGGALVCIDATHNVTMYENTNLTTLVVRDRWKHGIPVAWMLASNGCQPTIKYFLNVHRLRSPLTIPRYMICDFDWPEINACTEAYITCVLLCWWHVLHAWQQHLRVSTHPELWELLKRWIRITDKAEFDAAWVTTQNQEGVEDFVAYLAKYWMPEKVVRMWSAVYRTSRTIFEESNTNMLIEAWHHVLKGKFFKGKRNRRVDHLLNILINGVLPYYALKQRRQELGFEGPDIEVQKRKDILKRSKVYVKSDIAQIDDYKFLVPSKSNPAKLYEVDLDTYTCTCLDFPLISYCKHICAVQVLFDEPSAPDSTLEPPDVPSLSTLQAPPLPISAATTAIQSATPVSTPRTSILTLVAEKLERAAARLRRPRQNQTHLTSLPELEAALDAILLETDDGAVLPASQHLKPNEGSNWRKTMKAMMPGIKTKRKPAGDPAYGAGASSGSKATKKARKAAEQPKASLTIPTSPPSLIVPPSFPPVLTGQPASTYTYQYPYMTAPYPPSYPYPTQAQSYAPAPSPSPATYTGPSSVAALPYHPQMFYYPAPRM